MTQGLITICPSITKNGIRLYSKMADGNVIVESNCTTDEQMHAAQEAQDRSILREDKGWYHSGWFNSDSQSALCVCTLNDVDTLVFFESGGSINYIIDNTLLGNSSSAATCKNADKNVVPNSSSDSINVMCGSKLAVVGTPNLGKVVLFYQDKQGYLSYRTAEGLIWDDVPVRLCKAAEGTGIAAIGWSGLKHIRVYYQDEDYTVQEYRGAFGGDWSKGATLADEVTSLTTISAVHWFDETKGSEIRMYYQNRDRIAEKCWGVQAHEWSSGPTLFSGLPVNCSVNAFLRDLKGVWPVLSLWAATQGKDLHQRVYFLANGWGGFDQYKLPRCPQ